MHKESIKRAQEQNHLSYSTPVSSGEVLPSFVRALVEFDGNMASRLDICFKHSKVDLAVVLI